MRDSVGVVGQTPLQVHTNAIKAAIEAAAEDLPELEWRVFADVAGRALKSQRLP